MAEPDATSTPIQEWHSDYMLMRQSARRYAVVRKPNPITRHHTAMRNVFDNDTLSIGHDKLVYDEAALVASNLTYEQALKIIARRALDVGGKPR